MKSPRDTLDILDTLESQHPGADTELHFKTAFELLVATMLSAQSTDARVNMVTPALFTRYRDAPALAKATAADLEPRIHSTGFFRTKSRSLIGMAQALVDHHGGQVPTTMEALVELPGVGRKTANVVLGHALGIPGLPVDRHVLRVANRIGIAESDDPVVVEQQLCAAMPPGRWTRTSDTLILHGRRICRPKPLCDECAVRDECDYYRMVVSRDRSGRTHASAPTKKRRGSPVGADTRVPPSQSHGEARQSAKRDGGGPGWTYGSAPTSARKGKSAGGADPRVGPHAKPTPKSTRKTGGTTRVRTSRR